MIEIKNTLYTQRFFATRLPWSDLLKAVTYTQYEGEDKVSWFYRKCPGETCTQDISLSMDDILESMKGNTRNEIKRAIKEGIEFSYNYDYESFVPFYNDFCESKGIDLKTDVPTLAKYDKTVITVAKYCDIVLAMHATVVNTRDHEAMLLYSCSRRLDKTTDRKMIGWGNRYLHFKDFELFKSMGIVRYEWNGVCTNPERQDVYNISLFKLSFGGKAKSSLGLRTPLFVFMKWVQTTMHKIRG